MFTSRPSVFIASSAQSKDIAAAIKTHFTAVADVDIWTDTIFHLNQGTLESLLNRASYYDFFIGVFAADDVVIINRKRKHSTRDNVIFEFGLFLGRIGPQRSFFIQENTAELFSDLYGISRATFERGTDLYAAVAQACTDIKASMAIAQRMFHYTILPSTALAIGYYQNFLREILNAFNNQQSIEIVTERDRIGKPVKKVNYVIKGKYPIIEIRVPANLAALRKDILTRHTKRYTQIIIHAASRPYPFYVQGRFIENGPLRIFDIPTTLYTSYLTIKKVFSESFLNTDNNERELVSREIQNFQNTLERLMPEGSKNKFYRFHIYEDQ